MQFKADVAPMFPPGRKPTSAEHGNTTVEQHINAQADELLVFNNEKICDTTTGQVVGVDPGACSKSKHPNKRLPTNSPVSGLPGPSNGKRQLTEEQAGVSYHFPSEYVVIG